MKFKVTRQASLSSQKFQVTSDSKAICKVKAKYSKQKNLFDVTLSEPESKLIRNETCVIETNLNFPKKYLIYTRQYGSDKEELFGQVSYEICGNNDYRYTIIIGKRLYQIKGRDLRDRSLTIIDIPDPISDSSSNLSTTFKRPETLFQAFDSFSKSNKSYGVSVYDKEHQLGYIVITILLDLHESMRN